MAIQYVQAKYRHSDLLKPCTETSLCEDKLGNLCCVHSDIVQLRGARNARHAYEALMFTMAHMEISVSEKLGDITVREDNDMLHDGVGNFRIRTWEHPTVSQEANCAVFTQFFDNQPYDEFSDDSGYGVTSIDFVDQDDLYPYRPAQNMRRDLTIACVISARRDPENDQELVVVVERVGFIKMHSSALVSDKFVLEDLRNGITRWCDIVLSGMQDYAAST